MTAIVAITPHICAAELTAISPLPLIDIVSEVAAAIRTRGLKRIALLGTRFTVESRMFDRLGSMSSCRRRKKSTKFTTPIWMFFTTAARRRKSTACAKSRVLSSHATAPKPCCWPELTYRWCSAKKTPDFRRLTAQPYTSRQLRKSCSLTSPRAPECPLSAISGHDPYSISSSARASSCGVKAREALRRPDWPATRRRHRSPSPGPKGRPAALRTG